MRAAVADLVLCLPQQGIAYFLGGAVASILHGEIRTTRGIDVVLELAPTQSGLLVAGLMANFFVDPATLQLGVARSGWCLVIHRSTGCRVVMFWRRERAYSRIEMARRQPVELIPGLSAQVATAEDCVLSKLEWYEMGGRVSERQWRDVLGILKAQRERLDLGYMREWAKELRVSDLLKRACGEAGL